MSVKTFEFNELDHVSHSLKPYALRLTQDESRADDLMQEALLKAVKNQDKFTRGTSLKAWFYTIIRNQFFNEYHREKRRQTFLDTTDNLHYLNHSSVQIKNDALTNFNLEEINKAINKLSDLYKVPFMMHFQGFKYNEIAKTLDLPLGTVKNRIHVARKELKEKLKYLVYQD
jgi:RNA polymerase sigma-70 factor (ECF subfamily)